MISRSGVEAIASRALASGALQPALSDCVVVPEAGVEFVIRLIPPQDRKQAATRAGGDPLGDYDPDLFLGDVSPEHYLLLNKFPLREGHVLLVARRFEPQEALLTVQDFASLSLCMLQLGGLAFHNGGAEAGASQRRKHMQLVPLPLASEVAAPVPIEPLLEGGRLPFRHAFGRLSKADPAELHALYRKLLQECAIPSRVSEGQEIQAAPYNLLMTARWMLIVPRSRAQFESLPLNALGFAGSLFARTREQLELIRSHGPLNVLRAVAFPSDARNQGQAPFSGAG
jgi:ATP adenylyltransferase